MSEGPPSSDIGWTLQDLSFDRLEGEPPWEFDCGREEQNDYLARRALKDQEYGVSVTHLALVKGIVAAYFTWTMDAIRLYPHEKPDGVTYPALPALKLAQLGVVKQFQGFGLGRMLVAHTVVKAQELSAEVGCRYVTLDSQPDLCPWYERQGFKKNKLDQRERKKRAEEGGRDPDTLPVSMRFDIREYSGQVEAF